MKIIVAGFSKTGTKTLNAALSILGYKVYDFLEHFWYHRRYWNKIFDGKGSIDDFKEMYEDVDAVVDTPANMFWEEIHKAFPDSKIVLTVRDEDSWFKSSQTQITKLKENSTFALVQYFTKTGREMFAMSKKMGCCLFGLNMKSPTDFPEPNEMLGKRLFRQHQAYCLQNAPKDKLLVFDVREDWEPLCKFLGKEIPEQPFPRKNVGGAILADFFVEHPLAIQMKNEMINTFIILSVVVVMSAILVGYIFYF